MVLLVILALYVQFRALYQDAVCSIYCMPLIIWPPEVKDIVFLGHTVTLYAMVTWAEHVIWALYGKVH